MENTYAKSWITMGLSMFLMTIFIALDIYEDSLEGANWEHLTIEIVLLGLSSSMFLFVLSKLLNEKLKNIKLESTVRDLRTNHSKLKLELQKQLSGLAAVIDQQFTTWHLTPTEQNVGFLLLKGFSLKEIADFRKTSEKTVQVQAQSIYKKAGLGNRSEFAAFFLEDLLPGSIQNHELPK